MQKIIIIININDLGVKMDSNQIETTQVPTLNQSLGTPIASTNTTQKSKGLIIGMVMCVIFAIVGIAFGVWAILNGNAEKEQLNSQIDSLRQQNNELQEKINSGKTTTDDDVNNNSNENSVNPIISNDQESGMIDRVHFISAGNPRIRIILDNGDLFKCSVESDNDGDGGWDSQECNLGDVGGKIYKVVSFGGTQEFDPYIGFIMSDGTVKYFSFYNAINNGDYTIKTLSIDGKVTDAIKVASVPSEAPVGGYTTNVFILKNGTVVKYNESMTK